eukprot:CAMPEP_0114612238 /NCGR_PEP_ID=MMETSP0168-20121206/4520_1 /TAXON_ID=95228 ORGANISM="Vannella sp., Strain DIVA3 517/6/12" /NCGR_SAMPLE_ID=MMETSP0168 /ASSEMBLY_ACC=CAM_ASM_000044 /LENGTH=446 /DNA_ID=CAMNT_0001823219 /DNA_START=54 /DNA_END=1394 /DNA_ORIENTATION=-
MKTLALFAFVALLIAVSLAQNPVQLCQSTSFGGPEFFEGYIWNLASSPPGGFRVNIHIFTWRPQDTALYRPEYYFMRGASNDFVQVRWPWILQFSEAVNLSGGTLHSIRPIPLVLGENGAVVGFAFETDDHNNTDGDDVNPGVGIGTTTDSVFSIESYGVWLREPPLFTGQYVFSTNVRPDIACFTYTLDQFGATSLVAGGTRFQGFNSHSFNLHPLDGEVYNIISHSAVNLHGRFLHGALTAAGLELADGNRFTILPSRLQVDLTNGETADITLDEDWESNIHPLVLDLASGDDEVLPPVVFVASFSDREAALHDPLLASLYDLGNLNIIDEENTAIKARFTLTMASYEITFATVEVTGEDGHVSSHLQLMSHERAFLNAEGTIEDFLAGKRQSKDAHGLLGSTSGVHLHGDVKPAWELPGTFEDYRVAGDQLFGSEHKFNFFKQ